MFADRLRIAPFSDIWASPAAASIVPGHLLYRRGLGFIEQKLEPNGSLSACPQVVLESRLFLTFGLRLLLLAFFPDICASPAAASFVPGHLL